MPQVGRENEKGWTRIKIFKVIIPQIEMKEKSERAFQFIVQLTLNLSAICRAGFVLMGNKGVEQQKATGSKKKYVLHPLHKTKMIKMTDMSLFWFINYSLSG